MMQGELFSTPRVAPRFKAAPIGAGATTGDLFRRPAWVVVDAPGAAPVVVEAKPSRYLTAWGPFDDAQAARAWVDGQAGIGTPDTPDAPGQLDLAGAKVDPAER